MPQPKSKVPLPDPRFLKRRGTGAQAIVLVIIVSTAVIVIGVATGIVAIP